MQVLKLSRATEKMTLGLSRTVCWLDPDATDTGPFDFHVDQCTLQCLGKKTVHHWWRNGAPMCQGMSLGCFCLFMRQWTAFRKQRSALCTEHVQPFCMRGFGTQSWAAF